MRSTVKKWIREEALILFKPWLYWRAAGFPRNCLVQFISSNVVLDPMHVGVKPRVDRREVLPGALVSIRHDGHLNHPGVRRVPNHHRPSRVSLEKGCISSISPFKRPMHSLTNVFQTDACQDKLKIFVYQFYIPEVLEKEAGQGCHFTAYSVEKCSSWMTVLKSTE